MGKKPTLNIVIPVYNEEADLVKSVKTLRANLVEHLGDFDWFVTIADNASTDQTYPLAKQLTKRYSRVDALHLDKKGRGRAVRTAWQAKPADYYAYMDVDLSTDLKHFPSLVRSLLSGYDIAIGTRNARGSRVYGRNPLRSVTSKGYIFLIKALFWIHFSDAQCGFKAVTHKVVTQLLPRVVDNEWFFDTELLILAEKTGWRIYEESVMWVDNPGSTVRVLKTAQGDLLGLFRLFIQRPWRPIPHARH